MKKRNYPLWTELPYAGEKQPPRKAVEPDAGKWRTYFIQHDGYGGFKTLQGRPIKLDITDPNRIDWYQQLKQVQQSLASLTEKKITIARYWSAGPPTKQWTPIADRLIDTYSVEAPRAARILAALHAGINDAMVATWAVKFQYLVPRPNQLDPHLATVVCTPKHPSYVSGHSSVSGAAEVILGYFFPGEKNRLRQLAEEDAVSRLYAGVHYPADNQEGLKLGRQIGRIVISELKKDKTYLGQTDIPYRENRRAQLLPPPYEQAIPFDFDTSCDSLLLDLSPGKSNRNNYAPKPRLYNSRKS
ncbi:phosphatase PAP2 family protein [Bacillus lacus]|uniref:Phosphatase PAP2 family protein n=1 Tax=Metabacillus lacus TaxID=1983721 RepID=A0A7X2M0R6_9BACI|nr:vanadium-dependent haloperoxidase [Metabacillus lacus]MRX73537.1 phosphatase PAP2 family protein [Metabacillus lacus]